MSKGSLTILGSGIRSIGQLTLEAVKYIERADKVFYCVADPATAGYIKGRNASAIDLYEYYANSKARDETYIQMAEAMLAPVRTGLEVVGVFYGHAGSFVSPSRRALTIARSEGYKAVMLPGISAEDCLFADLLIDPSYPGAQTVEATDLIIRNRPLMTSGHVVIYQVGCVGQAGFTFQGYENNQFGYLSQRLEREYGGSHPVVNYKAAISPLAEPTIQRYTVADLSKADVQKTIDTTSTFYIPPKTLLPIADTAAITDAAWMSRASQLALPPLWADPSQATPSLYGPWEKEVVARAEPHARPTGYQAYGASAAMQAAVEKLSLDPEGLAAYTASPEAFAKSFDGLLPREAAALAGGDPNRIYAAMREGESDAHSNPTPPNTTVVVVVLLI
jgi:hypothetical protein